MNEVLKALKERRSIRKFKKELPAKEDIDAIIEAGLYAPSGKSRQDTIILCVTNPELIQKFVKANREIGGYPEDNDPFYGAPVVLVVLANADIPTYIYDGALVMGNLMNAAESLGLASIWIHRAREEFEADFGKNILADLGIEGNYVGIGNCAIGYAASDLPKAAPRKEDYVYYLK
jgi:nitroreductase